MSTRTVIHGEKAGDGTGRRLDYTWCGLTLGSIAWDPSASGSQVTCKRCRARMIKAAAFWKLPPELRVAQLSKPRRGGKTS
jgi:hypothetical protein